MILFLIFGCFVQRISLDIISRVRVSDHVARASVQSEVLAQGLSLYTSETTVRRTVGYKSIFYQLA